MKNDKIKCHNVGELVRALTTYDPITPIHALGADSGGYDTQWCAYVVVGQHPRAWESDMHGVYVGGDDNSEEEWQCS